MDSKLKWKNTDFPQEFVPCCKLSFKLMKSNFKMQTLKTAHFEFFLWH